MGNFEVEYCRKHGIEYVPPRTGKGKRQGPKVGLRPLVPTKDFATPALVATVTTQDTVTPQQTVTGLMALHRGPDGWVPFYRRHEGTFESVASVKVNELRDMLPGMVDVLAEDGFAAVNTMYRPGKGNSQLVPGARAAKRSKHDVRWLNACLVDLDVGREGEDGPKGLTIGQAIGALIDAQDSGVLPPVSIYARSGRGLYAMWALKAEDGNAQPGLTWAIKTAERVNKELAVRLEALAADRRVIDAARIIRIPGTRHSKVGTQAQYWVAAGQDGRGIEYTLSELSAALELPPPCATTQPRVKPKDGPVDSQLSEYGRTGNRTLWQQRYNEAWAASEAIGGIPEGRRRVCITLMGLFAYRAGMTPREITTAMESLAKRCRPPYPSYDDCSVDKLVENVLKGDHGFGYRLSKNYLGKLFKVNIDMARQLGLKALVPKRIADTVREDEQHQRQDERQDREQAALGIVRQWLEDRAQYPTGTQLATALVQVGYPVSQRTAHRLLTRLQENYPLPPTGERRGRPRTR